MQNFNNVFKVNYGCEELSQNTVDGSNPTQMQIVREKCKNSDECRIEASREFFGSECPGTDDAQMTLWLEYTCKGASDESSFHYPTCDNGTTTPPDPIGLVLLVILNIPRIANAVNCQSLLKAHYEC